VGKPSFGDFEQLVRENQRMIYQLALSVVGNAADAQDVSQDAFVRAYAKLDRLTDPQRFRAWICRIVRRMALNHVRANARSRRREEMSLNDAVTVVDVEAMAEDREFQRQVNAAVDRLPEKLREVVLLCAIEELEPSAVAGMLGIPPGTVRSRLHYGRKHLLRMLT
jgi:RNA polymerase sigma-70 factor (ECF subfamily)